MNGFAGDRFSGTLLLGEDVKAEKTAELCSVTCQQSRMESFKGSRCLVSSGNSFYWKWNIQHPLRYLAGASSISSLRLSLSSGWRPLDRKRAHSGLPVLEGTVQCHFTHSFQLLASLVNGVWHPAPYSACFLWVGVERSFTIEILPVCSAIWYMYVSRGVSDFSYSNYYVIILCSYVYQ